MNLKRYNFYPKVFVTKLYHINNNNFFIQYLRSIEAKYEKTLFIKPTKKFLNLMTEKVQILLKDKFIHNHAQYNLIDRIKGTNSKILLPYTTKKKGALLINTGQWIHTTQFNCVIEDPKILTDGIYLKEEIDHKYNAKLENDLLSNPDNMSIIINNIESQHDAYNICVQKTMDPLYCYNIMLIKLDTSSQIICEVINFTNTF